MCEREKIGIGEPGYCAAHEGVAALALTVAEIRHRLNQIVHALLRDARNLLIGVSLNAISFRKQRNYRRDGARLGARFNKR
jgi:hypothetical protein